MRTTLLTLAALLFTGFMPVVASAQNVDLILPANLASADAPFYQEAKIKIGNDIVPVREGNLPSGVLAQYQPENNAVVVSNNKAATEEDKGRALLDVVSAMEASAIMPAAGQ